MPEQTTDGRTRVAFVPSISNPAAPTTTELNAGTLLHSVMTPDGLAGFRPETADVDTSSLDSDFSGNTNGRVSYSGTMLRVKKQTGTDTVYDLLTMNTVGFIVVRRSIAASTAWVSSQKVEVYPIICAETGRIDPEPNTLERYEVPLKVTSKPTLRATVA